MARLTVTNTNNGKKTAPITTGAQTPLGDRLADKQIFITDDYARFVFNENRRIDDKHVQFLKKRIEAKNLNAESPVRVTSNYTIREGQHKMLALMELGLPIHYIFSDMTTTDTPIYNASHRAWKLTDYLDYYCDEKFHEYQVFSGFMTTYNLTAGGALTIVTGSAGGYATLKFRNGELNITDKLVECQRVADMIFSFKDMCPFFRTRSFILAMLHVFKNDEYDNSVMLHKMELRQSELHTCGRNEEYLKMLESIYNYKNSNKLRFF